MRVSFLILMFGAPLLAQQTWVVDRLNRPGANFTDLPPAVAAAANGDTILLRGTGPATPGVAYTAPTIDGRGLTIRGEGAATTRVIGEWLFRNLPATDRIIVSDVFLGGGTLAPADVGTFHGDSCAGAIIITGITMEGLVGTLETGFVHCNWVLLRNCDLRQLRPLDIHTSIVAVV